MQVINRAGSPGCETLIRLESGQSVTLPHGISEVPEDLGLELIKAGKVEAVQDKKATNKSNSKGGN